MIIVEVAIAGINHFPGVGSCMGFMNCSGPDKEILRSVPLVQSLFGLNYVGH